MEVDRLSAINDPVPFFKNILSDELERDQFGWGQDMYWKLSLLEENLAIKKQSKK
jgi:hypothetical protein